LIDKTDSVVPDDNESDARFMKQSSGGRETETSNTLDITGLGALLGPMTVEEANSLAVWISCISSGQFIISETTILSLLGICPVKRDRTDLEDVDVIVSSSDTSVRCGRSWSWNSGYLLQRF
jgi:hypothetical protein